ncbi:MAG: hypothetical protein ABGY42_03900, partial [bacterium]
MWRFTKSGATPYGNWDELAGSSIPGGDVLVWPHRSVGPEYTRHGFPMDRFGAFFHHLADSGFQPEILDMYNVNGGNFVNQVWRASNQAWRAYVLMGSSDFQKVFKQAEKAGFLPTFMESSTTTSGPRYTAIFVKNAPGAFLAKHGRSFAQLAGDLF